MLKFAYTFNNPCYFSETYLVVQFKPNGAYYLFTEQESFVATFNETPTNGWKQLNGRILSELLLLDLGGFVQRHFFTHKFI